MKLSHPIRLPCNPQHTFCRKCILPWLDSRNRCIQDCAIRPWDIAPWTEVDEVLINSVVEKLKSTGLDSLENEKLGGCRAMNWQNYLLSRREPTSNGTPVIFYQESYTSIEGPARVVPEQILLSIMTLANAIPLLVADSTNHIPYSRSERRDWQVVTGALLSLLPTMTEMVQNVEKMPYLLRKKIELKFSSSEVSSIPHFLQTDHVRSEDLDLLLEYLAATAFLARVAPEGPSVKVTLRSSSKTVSRLGRFVLGWLL